MTKQRIYVPSTLTQLAEIVVAGGVGPAPVKAHAVTEALRDSMPEGDEEEWEYAAMTAAAQMSIALLGPDDEPRRVVLAVDAPASQIVEGLGSTLVEVSEVVTVAGIAACHVDSDDALDTVAAARDAWSAADAGDPEADEVVERCLDHELSWFATQEIGHLLPQ